jgi:hypothetical protein
MSRTLQKNRNVNTLHQTEIDSILDPLDDQKIQLLHYVHHRLIADAILQNLLTAIETVIATVTVAIDHPLIPPVVLGREVTLNPPFPANEPLDEEKMDTSINPDLDETKTMRKKMKRKVRQKMVNVDFIQSIKSIYSTSQVFMVLMDVHPLPINVDFSFPS